MSAADELKLQRLVATIDLFVNGEAGTRVAIDNGRTVGTLAEIDKRAYKTKYVQKVFDYELLSQASLDAAGGVLIGVGNVVRVFGETDTALNRLYQVQEDKSLLQIDYTDIYDLKNAIPYPYNNKLVRQNLAQLRDPVTGHILTYTVEWSDVKAYNIFLTGRVKVSSHVAEAEGSSMFDFRMLVSIKDNTLTFNYDTVNPITLAPAGSNFPTAAPELTAVLGEPGDSYNIIKIKPVWDQLVIVENDPVMIEWFIENIDKTPFY